MDEKDFKEHLQRHRKGSREKIKRYCIHLLPLIVGILIVILAIVLIFVTQQHFIASVIPHKSSFHSEELIFSPSPHFFSSSDVEISWEAYDASNLNSTASVTFMVFDQANSDILVDITTTSYEEKLTNIDSSLIEYTWLNFDEFQDIKVYCWIKYHTNLFWGVLFIILGVILILFSVISLNKQKK